MTSEAPAVQARVIPRETAQAHAARQRRKRLRGIGRQALLQAACIFIAITVLFPIVYVLGVALNSDPTQPGPSPKRARPHPAPPVAEPHSRRPSRIPRPTPCPS